MTRTIIEEAGLDLYIAAKAILVKRGAEEGDINVGVVAFEASRAFEVKLEKLTDENDPLF